MTTSIIRIFDCGWSLAADLEPETRTLRLMQTDCKPIEMHELVLMPADAARIDLGNHEAALSFDGRDHPVVFLVEQHAGGSLIWHCERGESYWTGGPA